MSPRSLIQSGEERLLIRFYLSAVTEDVVFKMTRTERRPPADVSERGLSIHFSLDFLITRFASFWSDHYAWTKKC